MAKRKNVSGLYLLLLFIIQAPEPWNHRVGWKTQCCTVISNLHMYSVTQTRPNNTQRGRERKGGNTKRKTRKTGEGEERACRTQQRNTSFRCLLRCCAFLRKGLTQSCWDSNRKMDQGYKQIQKRSR